MNVTFIARHFEKPQTMSGNIFDACVTRTYEACEKCSKSYDKAFPCYYMIDAQNASTILAVYTAGQYKQQLTVLEKFSFLLTFLTYLLVLLPLFLLVVALQAWASEWDFKAAALKVLRELVYQSYSATPFEENCYLFDESDSPSPASFISTDAKTSYRKRSCLILLRNTIEKIAEASARTQTSSSAEPSIVITEKVLWYYQPSSKEMIRSLYSIAGLLITLPIVSIVILLVTLFELIIMAKVGATFFGLSFALILVVLPIVAVVVLVFQLGSLYNSHFFITNYRTIVLVELPLGLGFVIKYKANASIVKVSSRKIQLPSETMPPEAGSIIIYTVLSSVFSSDQDLLREIMLFEFVPDRKKVASILRDLIPEANAAFVDSTSEQSGLLEA